jgi:nidogen (entactin)
MSRARLFVFLATVMLSEANAQAAILYWSDSAGQRISLGNTDDGGMQTLFSSANGLVDPRGVAVDAEHGYLYFADAGTDRITRANLDGSQPLTIISTGLVFPSDIKVTPGFEFSFDDCTFFEHFDPDPASD